MIPDKDYNSKTCNHRRLKAQDHSNKLDLTTGQRKTFPEKDERIIDFDLTNCLLCYSTDVGYISVLWQTLFLCNQEY